MSPASVHVVVGYDFSAAGRATLYRAIGIAKRAPFHVLHFVCVVDPHTPLPQLPSTARVDHTYAERVQRAISNEVETELDNANSTARVEFFVHARIGKPASEILDVARSVGASLIIIGSHRLGGLQRFVLGSVSETVVREARCTVEVVRPTTYGSVDLAKIVESRRGFARFHKD